MNSKKIINRPGLFPDRSRGRIVKKNIYERFSSRAGFTLIEIMVVIVIIGILATMVGLRMTGKVGTAKLSAASAQINILGSALELFNLDVGRYPSSSEGLEALITQVTGSKGWNGPYLDKIEIPLDPWDNPYLYQSPGNFSDYDLYSYGKDKAEGGEGENRDIVSWKSFK